MLRALSRTLGLAATLTLALALGPAASLRAEPSEGTRQFLERAAQANLYELRSAEVAAARGGQTIQPLASLLLADHGTIKERLAVLADEQGVALPGDLEGAKEQQVGRLETISAAEFDRAFLEQQQAAHDEAIALFGGYAAEGEDAAVRAFAAEVLLLLNAHQDDVKSLLLTQ